MKLDWEPSVQLSVALETFLEEVKLELASIEFDKPKDNISTGCLLYTSDAADE